MTLQQTFIVNKDLKMTCGKICAQIAHGEVLYMKHVLNNFEYDIHTNTNSDMHKRYIEWLNENNGPVGMMKKIVLKATRSEIEDLFVKIRKDKYMGYLIFDKGLTQVEPDSLTALCIEPLPEEQCKTLFGNLKLL